MKQVRITKEVPFSQGYKKKGPGCGADESWWRYVGKEMV